MTVSGERGTIRRYFAWAVKKWGPFLLFPIDFLSNVINQPPSLISVETVPLLQKKKDECKKISPVPSIVQPTCFRSPFAPGPEHAEPLRTSWWSRAVLAPRGWEGRRSPRPTSRMRPATRPWSSCRWSSWGRWWATGRPPGRRRSPRRARPAAAAARGCIILFHWFTALCLLLRPYHTAFIITIWFGSISYNIWLSSLPSWLYFFPKFICLL